MKWKQRIEFYPLKLRELSMPHRNLDRTAPPADFFRYPGYAVSRIAVIIGSSYEPNLIGTRPLRASQPDAKVSKATATRHLAGLLEKGCLEKLPGGGRNTRYQIKMA
jgi:hypothetical protein